MVEYTKDLRLHHAQALQTASSIPAFRWVSLLTPSFTAPISTTDVCIVEFKFRTSEHDHLGTELADIVEYIVTVQKGSADQLIWPRYAWLAGLNRMTSMT